MSTIAKLLVALGIETDEFHKGLQESSNDLEGFSTGLASIGSIAVAAAATATTAMVGVGIAGVKAFAGFEKGMAEVFTLMPTASQSTFDGMTKDVKAFAMEFGVLPDKVIPGLYNALSSGVPSDNVFSFLEIAQKAATAGVTDLSVTVDGLTSVINAYGSESITAAQASDQMFAAVVFGKTTFEELSSTLYNVNPIAASLGVSFGDVTSAIAAMTAQGVPTAQTTTMLRQLMVELGDNTTAVGKQFKTLAGVGFKDFIASGGDVQGALQLLETHAIASGIGINELFGSVEAGGAALSLTGKGTELFNNALLATANSVGSTDRAFGTMNQTLAASFAKIQAAGSVFLITIGEKMAPAVALFANALVGILNAQTTMDFINAFGDAVAFTVTWLINASTVAIPQINAAFATMSTILTPIIGYFSSLAIDGDTMNDWLTHFPTVLQPVITVLGNYLMVWGNVATTIASVVSYLIGGDVQGAWNALVSGLGLVVTSYETYVTSLYTLLSGIGTWLITNLPIWGQMFVDWITPYIPIALEMLNTFAQSIITWISAQIAPYTAATASWVDTLVQWVIDAPALVLGYLIDLGASIVAWISSEATTFTSAFVAWYNALWVWIPPAIVQFLEQWPTMLEGFLDWVGASVGPILAGFGLWLMGIITWVAQSAPKILAALMKWGVEFIAWIAPQIPGMLVALAGLGLAIIVWVGQTSFILGKKLIEWGLAFIVWVAQNVLPALPGVLMGIGNLIFEFIKGAAQTALTLAKGIGKGIIDGIKSTDWGALGTWIKDKVVGMLNAAKSALGISSPSKEFADGVGTPIVLGIIQGLTATWPLVTKWLKGNMAKTVAEFLTSSATLVRGAYNIFKSLKDLQTAPPFQPLIDATDALKTAQEEAANVSGNLLDVNADIAAEIKAIQTAQHDNAVKHQRQLNEKLNELLAKQVELQHQATAAGHDISGVTAQIDALKALGATLTDAEKIRENNEKLTQLYDKRVGLQDKARSIDLGIADIANEINELLSSGVPVADNARLTELYAKQAQLLNDQAVTQANLVKLSQEKDQATQKAAIQQQAINQIAEKARQQYEAAQQQALTMMQTDAKGALSFFNERKAQIEEMAQLEKERALATTDEERRSLDTQIRLLQAAQSAESTASNVNAMIQINPSGQSDQKIIDIIARALRDAGIVVDIRTRTT